MKRNVVIAMFAAVMIRVTAFGQEKENAAAGKTGLTVFERVPLNGAVTAEGIGFGKLRLGSVRFSHDETHRRHRVRQAPARFRTVLP